MTGALPRFSRGLADMGEWQEAVRRWEAEELVERLWARDASVWGSAAPEADRWLGWLDLPGDMAKQTAGFARLAEEVVSDGIEDVVLMGMGGSSLAPEMFFSVFGRAPGHPRLRVIDSTHPEAVASLRGAINLSRTFFVVSSKSGTTVETLSFYRFFWKETGGDARRFAAITDAGTPLDRLARERNFRAVFNPPADVGGRFSAFSAFGLVPAALIGADTRALLARAEEMAAAARRQPAHNPAVSVGLMWGAAARAGMDKLTLRPSQSLSAFGAWMEQLVAESLGKDGGGIIPVAGEPIRPPESYGADRVVALWHCEGDPPLSSPGGGDIHIKLADPLDLGAELFRAELGVAAAGEVLGVNPFNQPDVEEAKRLASRAMTRSQAGAGADAAPAHTAQAQEAVGRLVEDLQPGDYLGLHAYLPPDPRIEELLGRFRRRVTRLRGVPTTFGYGPRYLHSTGQAHKGGPPGGSFLQIVDDPKADIEVPGADYGFAKLISAQAEGDHAALLKAGRRAVRINVGSDRLGGLRAILKALS